MRSGKEPTVDRWLEYRSSVGPDLALELEDWFCQEYQDSWMLTHDLADQSDQLIGYFTDETEASAAIEVLRRRFPALPQVRPAGEVGDDDWVNAYREHFHPWSDRGLHFVPVWEAEGYRVPEGESVILLNPGMAFGTGNHETTRLCLRRLLDIRDGASEFDKIRVVDAGCGSGILSIAARKLGATLVRGFDNDQDAVEIARENAERDGLPGEIDFGWLGLDDGLPEGKADLLLANIISDVLVAHRDRLIRAVAPGGSLVLSGILVHQIGEFRRLLIERAAELWGQHPRNSTRTDGTWADLLLLREAEGI